MRLLERRNLRVVAARAQCALIILEQPLVIAAVNFMADKTILAHRRMHDLALEFAAIVTSETQILRVVDQQPLVIGRVRTVAYRAVAIFCRRMDDRLFHPQFSLVVACITKRRAVFLKPQHSH